MGGIDKGLKEDKLTLAHRPVDKGLKEDELTLDVIDKGLAKQSHSMVLTKGTVKLTLDGTDKGEVKLTLDGTEKGQG